MPNSEPTSKEIANLQQGWQELKSEADIRGVGATILGAATAAQEQAPESNDK